MKGPLLIFIELVQSADRVDSVEQLSDGDLVCVAGWLRRDYQENEVTGEILGICLVEEAGRFSKRVREERGQEFPATLNNGEGFL